MLKYLKELGGNISGFFKNSQYANFEEFSIFFLNQYFVVLRHHLPVKELEDRRENCLKIHICAERFSKATQIFKISALRELIGTSENSLKIHIIRT